ncbi:integrase catalytic domain-containing protein [Trichonephila clavipes]|nr:integrase catalytic domain-containing protein [Trichonephila clavipes]
MILDHVLGKNILVKNAQESQVTISKLDGSSIITKKRVYWPLGKVISLLPGRDGKVRTLKLKCKNSELIRPIQRVYLLEVPVINNEIVKIDGVPTSSVNKDKLTSNAIIKNKVTRSGRLVKLPERLGLFNEVFYAFE